MRILFTTLPALGHLNALVTLARALARAGHDVAFATAPSFRPAVNDIDFPSFDAGIDFEGIKGPSDASEDESSFAELRKVSPQQNIDTIAAMFIAGFGEKMARDLLSVASQFRPDLMVRGSFEFAAPIAAERLGIPHISVQAGGISPAQMSGRGITTLLDDLRSLMGLAPDPGQEALYRYLHLCPLPASYFGGKRMPATTRYVRARAFDGADRDALPMWFENLGSRPIVYVTLGTVVNRLSHVMTTIIDGLRGEPIDVVVTVGRNQDPACLGALPDSVRVEHYIPNSLVMPRCDLAIMHGGFGSVMSALSEGVPMILVPFFADQPENARACVSLGLAMSVAPERLDPDIVRSMVRKALAGPELRNAARGFQQEVEALPSIGHAIELIEFVARTRQPVLALRPG